MTIPVIGDEHKQMEDQKQALISAMTEAGFNEKQSDVIITLINVNNEILLKSIIKLVTKMIDKLNTNFLLRKGNN